MRKTIRHILMAALVLPCLPGCNKYSPDCHVIIRPRVIRVQSSPAEGEAAYMARAYTYYISEDDIDNWEPSSFEDADAGIIRHLGTGEIRSHDFMGEQSEVDTYIHFTLSRSPVLIVAVDPINRFYAWRELEIPVPLASLQVTLRFILWRSETRFTDSEWTIVNGNPEEGGTEDIDRRPGVEFPEDNRKAEGYGR